MQRFGGGIHIARRNHQRAGLELLARPGSFREHHNPIPAVDQRAFLGDQVHTVSNRINQQHVVQLQRRNGSRIAFAGQNAHRLPLACAVA